METEMCISKSRSSGERVKRKHRPANEKDNLAPGNANSA